MKNALILHGTKASHESNWFSWLHNELEKKEYQVWTPDLPQSEVPNIDRYNEFIFANKNFTFTDQTILIGHSSGAVAILGLLQALPEGIVVDTCYLVSAFTDDLGWDSLKELFLTPFDFEKIKSHAKRFVFLHSDNDPYCPVERHGQLLANKLDGELLIREGQKHFSIGTAGEQYRQFPFLLKLILPDFPVPFYGNTPDDTHCFQAALRMVTKKYFPREEYTWGEWENITAKVKGLWTWPTAGLLWLQQKGSEIKVKEVFEYQRFIDEGEAYLLEFFGEEVGKQQIKYSDIPQEQKLLSQALKSTDIVHGIPTLEDLKELLVSGYVLICNVNAKVLNEQSGYAGHFVVVYDCDGENFTLHDPGLPLQPERKVSLKQFEKAWSYPDEKSQNVVAIRRPVL
jgi:predicted alpha/beta hydrolase family esterase